MTLVAYTLSSAYEHVVSTTATLAVPAGTANGDILVSAWVGRYAGSGTFGIVADAAFDGAQSQDEGTLNFPFGGTGHLRIDTRVASSEPASYDFTVKAPVHSVWKGALLTIRGPSTHATGAMDTTAAGQTTTGSSLSHTVPAETNSYSPNTPTFYGEIGVDEGAIALSFSVKPGDITEVFDVQIDNSGSGLSQSRLFLGYAEQTGDYTGEAFTLLSDYAGGPKHNGGCRCQLLSPIAASGQDHWGWGEGNSGDHWG